MRATAPLTRPRRDIPFSANVKYSFRLVVNIPAQTYSIYVTPAGGTEQTVGTDFAFRPTAGTITNLNNWGAIDDTQGSADPCATSACPHELTRGRSSEVVRGVRDQGRRSDTIVRNLGVLSPGSCRLAASSPGSHSLGSKACLVVLKETWMSPQSALMPTGCLAVV